MQKQNFGRDKGLPRFRPEFGQMGKSPFALMIFQTNFQILAKGKEKNNVRSGGYIKVKHSRILVSVTSGKIL